jgi:hypothetical protein
MLAEIAGGKNASLGQTRALDSSFPWVLLFIATLAGLPKTRLSRALSGMDFPKREMSESGYGRDGLRLRYALTCGRLR